MYTHMNKWILKKSWVKLARLRRPKIACFSSYVDYRPKTSAVALSDMWENAHRRSRARNGNLKLECGWCVPCRRVNIVILNWSRPLWEGDQEGMRRSGKDEPMWVAVHKCMEAMLGMSLYSYLYLKLIKMIYLSYFLLCFSSTILEKKPQKQGLGGR
jgi:hypothetical protein